MRKSHFNEQFLVFLGPIISRFFACSNEEKNKPKQQSVGALFLSLSMEQIIGRKILDLTQIPNETIFNHGSRQIKIRQKLFVGEHDIEKEIT
jgi:hypothetical protein